MDRDAEDNAPNNEDNSVDNYGNLRIAGIIVGLISIGLAVVRLRWPDLKIDNTTILLLLLGALPWLLPHIKTLKLTGIGEIEFGQKLQAIQETVAATQSAVISGIGKSPSAMGWQHSILTVAEADEKEINSDPHKGKFGGAATHNGYRFRGAVKELPGTSELFEVVLSVDCLRRPGLIDGQSVTFHLHPTFRPPVISVKARDGRAILKRYAWGAFTVGAVVETDSEQVMLELDLADLADAPSLFRSR